MGLYAHVRAWNYEAHCDEAAFLYEQRLRFLEDPEVTIDDVAEIEARLEAHLDGLFLGGEQAADMCGAWLASDDAGAVHTAIRVLCRQDRRDALAGALVDLSAHDDAEVARAAVDALCLELPEGWSTLAQEALEQGGARMLALWAPVVGYRRWLALGPQLVAAAQRAGDLSVDTTRACARALGDLGSACAAPWCRELVQRAEPAVARAAAIALIKCNALKERIELEKLCVGLPAWTALPLLWMGAATSRQLEDLALRADDALAADALLALAMSGEAANLSRLLPHLSNPERSGNAAVALHLLLGTPCLERVELPDPDAGGLADDLVDPDAAVSGDSELDAETPVRRTFITRLSRDPERWRQEIEARPELRDSRAPIRMGEPLSGRSTSAALQATSIPSCVRELLADELQIRLGSSVTYRVFAEVREQRRALSALRAIRLTGGRHG